MSKMNIFYRQNRKLPVVHSILQLMPEEFERGEITMIFLYAHAHFQYSLLTIS